MDQIQKHPDITINPCQSSRVHGWGYDEATQTLAVQFKGKNVDSPSPIYHYAGVTPPVVADLKKAESVGRFIAQVIQSKDEHGKLNYPYTKIPAVEKVV